MKPQPSHGIRLSSCEGERFRHTERHDLPIMSSFMHFVQIAYKNFKSMLVHYKLTN